MTSAARNLTPVTLELGGKCPAIFDYLPNPSDFKVTRITITTCLKYVTTAVVATSKNL